jgi:carboxyl-terminal processing protease
MNMRTFASTVALTLLLLPCTLRADDDPAAAAATLAEQIAKLVDVFATVDDQAADPVSAEQAFYQGAIPGMLRTLDPHSIFFDPGQFQQLQQMQRSESKGFGTVVSVIPGRVIILQTLEGGPAAKAGLSAGDEILAINNIPLGQLVPEQLMQLLGQARQQAAQLDVRKPGNARAFRLVLSPELIDEPSVDRAFLLGPGIGYIRIKAFELPTGKLVKESIEKLGGDKSGGSGLRGLVLDLRDNPGGAVQAAVEVASLFLQPDQIVFTIRGRSEQKEEARVPAVARPFTFPLAILMDEKSASASEILAGALQDHDRAVVLGEASYGKGIVQNVFPLSANSGLALTIAFYYTPSGRSLQKPLASGSLDVAAKATPGIFHTDAGREVVGGGGIQPDVVVPPQQISRLVFVLEASGSLTQFAGEYVQTHEIGQNFGVTPELLDQLKVFLSQRDIQPSIGDWLRDRDLIQSKLRQEIVNLKFGVAQGDQIEMQRDVLVQRAIAALNVSPR